MPKHKQIQNILRRPEVQKSTGYSCPSLYRLMAKGRFPKPIQLGPKAVGWLETDILEWQRARIAKRDEAA
jgi:prophage regulatory protein